VEINSDDIKTHHRSAVDSILHGLELSLAGLAKTYFPRPGCSDIHNNHLISLRAYATAELWGVHRAFRFFLCPGWLLAATEKAHEKVGALCNAHEQKIYKNPGGR